MIIFVEKSEHCAPASLSVAHVICDLLSIVLCVFFVVVAAMDSICITQLGRNQCCPTTRTNTERSQPATARSAVSLLVMMTVRVLNVRRLNAIYRPLARLGEEYFRRGECMRAQGVDVLDLDAASSSHPNARILSPGKTVV